MIFKNFFNIANDILLQFIKKDAQKEHLSIKGRIRLKKISLELYP